MKIRDRNDARVSWKPMNIKVYHHKKNNLGLKESSLGRPKLM